MMHRNADLSRPRRYQCAKEYLQILTSQNARESHRNNVIPQLWASSDLCDKTYQRWSVPLSSLLLSTYCISELLRIYLAPTVFDNSANNGGMQMDVCLWRVSAPFSIQLMSMQSSSSEGRTTGLFFLERSPIYWWKRWFTLILLRSPPPYWREHWTKYD